MTYNGKPVALTFKKMVEFIANVNSEAEWNEAYALIEFSFQKEKITWNDMELMFSLLGAKMGQLKYSGIIKE